MKKFMLGAGLASTVAIGSVVFTGGDIIDQVNTKVAGMFDMISTYESNETKLANKINELKSTKKRLEEDVDNLMITIQYRDDEISTLNSQIADLNRQIEILEGQLGNQNGLAEEINRLEGEVNRANNKVAELQTILDTPITDVPLTEEEMNDVLYSDNFAGTIYFTNESSDETIVPLSSYAELSIKKFVAVDDSIEFLCTVKSTTDDGFNVEIGNEFGSQGDLCHSGQPFVFKQFLGSEYNYTYIKINDGEFIYNLVVE